MPCAGSHCAVGTPGARSRTISTMDSRPPIGCSPLGLLHGALWVLATQEYAELPHVLQLRLHGNRRTGRSTGLHVHRCGGATLAMTESTCMPHPLQVVFPQRLQRAGLHMWLSLIHISEPTRLGMISYAVFCLKKKKTQ